MTLQTINLYVCCHSSAHRRNNDWNGTGWICAIFGLLLPRTSTTFPGVRQFSRDSHDSLSVAAFVPWNALHILVQIIAPVCVHTRQQLLYSIVLYWLYCMGSLDTLTVLCSPTAHNSLSLSLLLSPLLYITHYSCLHFPHHRSSYSPHPHPPHTYSGIPTSSLPSLSPYFKAGAFHRNAGHVLQSMISLNHKKDNKRFTNRGLAFQEYDPRVPHQELTLGYAGE